MQFVNRKLPTSIVYAGVRYGPSAKSINVPTGVAVAIGQPPTSKELGLEPEPDKTSSKTKN